MLIRDSGARLRAMFAEQGAEARTKPATVFEVFHRFARLEVEDAARLAVDGDLVLAQFGTYDFRGNPEFSVDLTRQFIESEDEDSPMWQLSCTLYWDHRPATDALGAGHLWSSSMELDAFVKAVAALPGWAWALATSRAPDAHEIVLDRI